jgi:hypothetical protein
MSPSGNEITDQELEPQVATTTEEEEATTPKPKLNKKKSKQHIHREGDDDEDIEHHGDTHPKKHKRKSSKKPKKQDKNDDAVHDIMDDVEQAPKQKKRTSSKKPKKHQDPKGEIAEDHCHYSSEDKGEDLTLSSRSDDKFDDIEIGKPEQPPRLTRHKSSALEASDDPFAQRDGKTLLWRNVNMTLVSGARADAIYCLNVIEE